MKFGAMNFPVRPIIGEIHSIAALGFDYMEIAMDHPEASPDLLLKNAVEIRKVIRDEGLDVLGHMPTFVSLQDLSDRIQRASLEETLCGLEAAKALGIQKVTIHPGYVRGLQRFFKDTILNRIQYSLNEIISQARSAGIVICLENLFPPHGLHIEASDFEPLMKTFPDAKITLDIGHAQINATKNRSFEFLEKFSNRISHIHVSDTWGKEDQHLPVGAGIVDFPAILKQLKSIGYDRTITLEVFSPDRNYLKASLEILKNMLS